MSDVRNGRWAGELSGVVLSPFLPCFLFACLVLHLRWFRPDMRTFCSPSDFLLGGNIVLDREAIQNRVCSLSEMVCQFCVHWAKRHECGGWELKSKQECLRVPLLLPTMSLLRGRWLSQSPGKTSVGLRKIPEEDFPGKRADGGRIGASSPTPSHSRSLCIPSSWAHSIKTSMVYGMPFHSKGFDTSETLSHFQKLLLKGKALATNPVTTADHLSNWG